MENLEFKKRDIDLSEMKNNLNEINAEYEKKLSELDYSFENPYGSKGWYAMFNKLKGSEIPKNILELEKENAELKSKANSYDEIFSNPCKNTNRFTDNVVLVNIEDLTDEFKEGKLFN